jgi:hypothetical protein
MQNECRRCSGTGQPSKGYGKLSIPIGHDHPGQTRMEVTDSVVHCLKCTQCGHSWIPANFPPQKTTNDE